MIKKSLKFYWIVSLLMLISCINRTEKIDDIDKEMTSYQYILSSQGILKAISAENNKLILYDTKIGEVAAIEGFNYGAYLITNWVKDTIEVSFFGGKSDFELSSFTNHKNDDVRLGNYKIVYNYLTFSSFGNSKQEIIDSIKYDGKQFCLQLFKQGYLVDNIEIKDIIFTNKTLTKITLNDSSVLFKDYVLTKNITPKSIVKEIIAGYNK